MLAVRYQIPDDQLAGQVGAAYCFLIAGFCFGTVMRAIQRFLRYARIFENNAPCLDHAPNAPAVRADVVIPYTRATRNWKLQP